MAKKQLKPVHPGEVLLEEFLKPMKLSQNRLALDIGVPPRRINEIVSGKRSVTADTALRLARYFHMSPQFWLGLQMDYDLDVTADTLANRPEPRGEASRFCGIDDSTLNSTSLLLRNPVLGKELAKEIRRRVRVDASSFIRNRS